MKKKALIEWPGSEPVHATIAHALNTAAACAFLREPVRTRWGGKWQTVKRPPTVTGVQAIICEEILLHRVFSKLMAHFPQGTPARLVGPNEAPWNEGWMLEVDHEWTFGPSVTPDRSYRAAIQWHAYDPDGDPLAENTTEAAAAAAFVAGWMRNRILTNWNA